MLPSTLSPSLWITPCHAPDTLPNPSQNGPVKAVDAVLHRLRRATLHATRLCVSGSGPSLDMTKADALRVGKPARCTHRHANGRFPCGGNTLASLGVTRGRVSANTHSQRPLLLLLDDRELGPVFAPPTEFTQAPTSDGFSLPFRGCLTSGMQEMCLARDDLTPCTRQNQPRTRFTAADRRWRCWSEHTKRACMLFTHFHSPRHPPNH